MSVPIVSISEFKANPARFMRTGAVVTNHGRPRARLVPIDPQESVRADTTADAAKAALRVLYRLQSEADVADELADLSAIRDADIIGDPL
jgi:prevent-host-death family protein